LLILSRGGGRGLRGSLREGLVHHCTSGRRLNALPHRGYCCCYWSCDDDDAGGQITDRKEASASCGCVIFAGGDRDTTIFRCGPRVAVRPICAAPTVYDARRLLATDVCALRRAHRPTAKRSSAFAVWGRGGRSGGGAKRNSASAGNEKQSARRAETQLSTPCHHIAASPPGPHPVPGCSDRPSPAAPS